MALVQRLGVEVVLPVDGMPDPHHCREAVSCGLHRGLSLSAKLTRLLTPCGEPQVWVPYIRDTLKVDARTLLVGHSSGADAVIRFVPARPPALTRSVAERHTTLGFAC